MLRSLGDLGFALDGFFQGTNGGFGGYIERQKIGVPMRWSSYVECDMPWESVSTSPQNFQDLVQTYCQSVAIRRLPKKLRADFTKGQKSQHNNAMALSGK